MSLSTAVYFSLSSPFQPISSNFPQVLGRIHVGRIRIHGFPFSITGAYKSKFMYERPGFQILVSSQQLTQVSQDLRTLADDQYTVIGVEKPEEIVRVADDVPGLAQEIEDQQGTAHGGRYV